MPGLPARVAGQSGDSLTDDEFARLKQELRKFYEAGGAGRQLIDARLEEVNGSPGHPGSFTALDAVLSSQFYRLAHWRLSAEEINYRRFFDISELIGVRVEDGDVFRLTHTLIFRLIERGLIDGLRIDHIDGLFDPTAYLGQVRQRFPDMYLIVEKILEDGEDLPAAWPVQGTTGYDFLNAVNGLFVSEKNAGPMERLYRAFTGLAGSAAQLLREKKRLVLNTLFRGELKRLCRLTERIAAGTIRCRDLMGSRLRQALAELLIAFPVYRTYVDGGVIREADPRYIGQALAEARSTRPGLDAEIDFIAALFDPGEGVGGEQARAWRGLFQQLSSPLTAKGFEDTFLYVYNRLLSLNEVGGFPRRFGISPQNFHRFCAERHDRWPDSLNATATHDTKRGEDARARLNVLSEIPGPWTRQIRHFSRLNRRRKSPVCGQPAPDRNDEYLLYQALIGAYPFEGNTPEFRDRMKALRRQGPAGGQAPYLLDRARRRLRRGLPAVPGSDPRPGRGQPVPRGIYPLPAADRPIRHAQLAVPGADQDDRAGRARFLSGDRALGFQPRRPRQPAARGFCSSPRDAGGHPDRV